VQAYGANFYGQGNTSKPSTTEAEMIANRVLVCNSDTSTAAAIGPRNMAEPNAPKNPTRVKANIPATVNISIRLNEIFISALFSTELVQN
jgi:hypothetical protein